MSWSDERIAMLTDLWAKGLSASQIAEKLGQVSRNAVIGKIHRLGLSGRRVEKSGENGATSEASSSSKQKAAAGANGDGQTNGQAAKNNAQKLKGSAKRRSGSAIVKYTNILTLQENSCKFPIGEPGTEDFHFCGEPVEAGTPYCPHHCQIAYQPPADRRRTHKFAGAV